MRVLKSFAYILTAALIITGCSSIGGGKESSSEQKVENMYERAKASLQKGNYPTAIRQYRALETTYPFGSYTEQGRLDLIFAYDKNNQADEALEVADNFIKLYPTHKNIDYAYYMRGVVKFEKQLSRVDRFLRGSKNDSRDPKPLRDSYNAFAELIKRFPESPYVADAKQRMIYLNDALAKRELQVANFYYNTGAYVAVINRCKTIIQQYDTAPTVEQALILMVKTYDQMGLHQLAASTQAVLEANFENSENYAQSNEKQRKSVFKRLFKRGE